MARPHPPVPPRRARRAKPTCGASRGPWRKTPHGCGERCRARQGTPYRRSVLGRWPRRGYRPPPPAMHRRIRLEHLCHVERAAAQRRQVVRHRSVGYSIELRRIDTLLAQVVLQAQPGRRHFRHGRYLQTRQISQPKAIDFADEKERIARNDFAKANERRIGVEVAGLHHPHRSAPREVDRSVKQTRSRGSRRRRVEQVYFDALAGIESESVRGVEWRVEHRAKILSELDPHGRRYPMAAMSGSDGGILSVRGAFG